MTERPLASIVVPCYNEAENIPLLAGRIAEVFAGLPGFAYECLFVDDGSTDDTRAVLAGLAAAAPGVVRPITLAHNMGQSAALLAGMRHARGAYILTLDGDMQNDPADFPAFLDALQTYDCVCGYRAERHDAWHRRAASRVANAVRNALLGDGIRDSGCGAKGFRRHCVDHFVPFNGLHRFFAVFVRRAGLTIHEMPVRHHPRRYGHSKYGINNRLWRGLYDLIGVAWLRRRYVAIRLREDA